MTMQGKFLGLGIDSDYLVRVVTVNITNAQLKALRATPKVLIPAQGTNTLLQIQRAVIRLNAGTNVLTETDDNLVVRYTGTTGAILTQTIEMTGFIDQAVNMLTGILPIVDPIVIAANGFNKPLVLHNSGDGEFGGNAAGDATLTLKVVYRVYRF